MKLPKYLQHMIAERRERRLKRKQILANKEPRKSKTQHYHYENGILVESKGILDQKIFLNRLATSIALAFGVTRERKEDVLRKMIAVAKVYPKYSVIAEVMLNCDDRFTLMERLYSLFELGKIKGTAGICKQAKVLLKFNKYDMPLEVQLLNVLSKFVEVDDPMKNLLKNGR